MIELTFLKKMMLIKQANIFHYWYFSNKGFKFQPNVCNRCNDLLMISMNLSDIAIFNIKSADYQCVISGTSKSEAVNSMQNIELTKKVEKCY